MILEEIMAMYYKAEQNIKISCFWDGGWHVEIGDDINGYKDNSDILSIKEAKEFLLKWYEENLKR